MDKLLCSSIIIFSIVILFLVIKSLYKSIRVDGFLSGNIFLSISVLFYVIIPLIYILFENKRDTSTLFNMSINMHTYDTICLALFECSMIVGVMVLIYMAKKPANKLGVKKILYKNVNTYSKEHWEKVDSMCRKNIERIANLTLILGGVSEIVLILSVGGVSKYLALGSFSRGIGKDVTTYISSSLLPLITLNGVILTAPYLYRYLMKYREKSIYLKIKFCCAFSLSIIYLLYNQGRLPLLLFFVPFLLDLKIAKKAKISSLIALAIISVPLLDVLAKMFTYFTYGYWGNSGELDLIQTLLYEFTYPFSNFLNRNQLVSQIGLRMGIDYVQWPLLLIPASITKIFGISKSGIQTMGALNTNAYAAVLNSTAGGGIPTDVLLFNYAQFGTVSLVTAIIILMLFFRKLDDRIKVITSNDSFKIITLRVCILIVSIVNNFDFSVIFRMRVDLVILICVIFYYYKVHRRILGREME